MNEMERQIFAAAFAAAFSKQWAFMVQNKGVREAMRSTSDGFQFAKVADQAVLAYRNSLKCDDRIFLLSVKESWPAE